MARAEAGPKSACCMISEMLEEAGVDRESIRTLRRQVLEGVMTLCQWQLERMQRPEGAASAPPRKKARRVPVD